MPGDHGRRHSRAGRGTTGVHPPGRSVQGHRPRRRLGLAAVVTVVLTPVVPMLVAVIAGILLVVGAGGGFVQTLVDAGVGDLVGRYAGAAALSPLLLGRLVAVGNRVATGSATVATITAAGIVAPLAAGLEAPAVALLALALGAGSLFFSHVNDVGFWLVKEYFGLSVGQTITSWSLMETIISVMALLLVLLLSRFV